MRPNYFACRELSAKKKTTTTNANENKQTQKTTKTMLKFISLHFSDIQMKQWTKFAI